MSMTIELKFLALSIVLGFVHIVLASHAKSRAYGYRWTAGARDEAMPPLAGVAGRLERALENFGETFPFFAPPFCSPMSPVGIARSRFGARSSIFGGASPDLPLYAFRVPLVRSLVWNVAAAGIFLILLGLL